MATAGIFLSSALTSGGRPMRGAVKQRKWQHLSRDADVNSSSSSDDDVAWMARRSKGVRPRPPVTEASEGPQGHDPSRLAWMSECVQHPEHWAVYKRMSKLQGKDPHRWACHTCVHNPCTAIPYQSASLLAAGSGACTWSAAGTAWPARC